MSLITCAARPGVCARTRIVMLPAAFSTPQDFVQAGFVEAVRARRLDVDLVFAGLALEHVTDRGILTRLREELILPARALGCTLWLGGISLGAYLALCGAERVPGAAGGPVPVRPVSRQSPRHRRDRARAADLAHWRPGPLAEADEERRVWRYIATLVSDPLPVHLGLGREDRFAGRHRLLADALGPERVDVVPGGHDWPTWVRLWERFLDTRLARTPNSRRAITRRRIFPSCPLSRPTLCLKRPRAGHGIPRRWCAHPLRCTSAPLHSPWCAPTGGRGHSARWLPTTWAHRGGGTVAAQPPARTELDAPARARVARRAPSPSPSTTARILRSRRACSTCSASTGARATFFCIGERIEQLPAARARDRRAPVTASRTTPTATRCASRCSGPGGHRPMRCGARRQAIRAATGEIAQFFRAPAGLRNPFLDAGARAAQPAPGQLDTPRLRHRERRTRERVLARLTRDLRRAATSCCCTTGTRRARPPAPRSSSRCCRGCWHARGRAL